MTRKKIEVMINGLPGRMATEVLDLLSADKRFDVKSFGLTGPKIPAQEYRGVFISPEKRLPKSTFQEIKGNSPDLIAIDFTEPDAVLKNAQLYCRYGINFVMGTTGGDREALKDLFNGQTGCCAVIAPNMAKQIVLFQAMMEFAASNFPKAFAGYQLAIKESHQVAKKDISGTAKAIVELFNQLGLKFQANQIQMIRDPKIQINDLGVPEEFINGHGWHTYDLLSADGNVNLAFTHNVNGRGIYAQGTRDAVIFLAKKIAQGKKGQLYSMTDVLRG